MSNVLPLSNGDGLDPELDLYILDNQKIREGETIRFEVELSFSRRQRPIKITLCWYDPPAPMGSARSLLMHDLDLVVLAPDGTMHWGNANRGQDSHSAGDKEKVKQRGAGDPPWSNSSFPGWAWADDSNPNEQVYIKDPHCRSTERASTCKYTAYIHAGLMPLHTYQSFAIILTSPGVVTEAITSDRWFDDLVPYGTNHPPVPPKVPNYLAATIPIKGGLAGGELVSTTRIIEVCACTALQFLDITLIFHENLGVYASPNNLELTIGKLKTKSHCKTV